MRKPSPLYGIVSLFVLLSLVYMWATPIFEASDELWHFGMVQYIAENGRLPVQNPGVETIYRQEGSQPPLYYALAALMVRPIDRSDFEQLSQPNPHPQTGIPGAVGNKNMVMHDIPVSPWQGTALSVYLLRGFGVLLGTVTVIGVYQTARLLGGAGFAAMAAGLTAFNPMFIFISASVNNDNLVIALNTLVIWQLVVMLWHGFGARRSLLIAVLISLASLSKLSGNVLVPVVALMAVTIAWRSRDWRGFFTLGFLMDGVWAVTASWWYVRNLVLYGELFGTGMMAQVAGPRLEPFTLQTLFAEFEGFRIAYWGLFGGVNIQTVRWFYWLMDGLTVAAAVGVGLALIYVVPLLARTRRIYGKLYGVQDALADYWLNVTGAGLLTLLLASVSLIRWTAQTYASQGRLLFPFIGFISLLMASGLWYIWRWHKPMLTGGVFTICLGFAATIPFVTIRPAYTPPPVVDALPEDAEPVYARFGDVELIGYQTPKRRYGPGDDVPMTVYWRALDTSPRDLSAFLVAVTPEGEAVGTVNTYPGGGTLRTSTWQAGAIYADTYAVPLRPDARGDFNLRVQVGWWHYPTEDIVQPVDEDGTPLESVMLAAGGFSDDIPPDLPDEVVILDDGPLFGGHVRLTGYEANADTLTLVWDAVSRLSDDYTVFVQVFNADGELVGQGDRPPSLSTRYWQRGDRLLTHHPLTYTAPLPPGNYTVFVGWYRPADFTRLPLPGNPDNAYRLYTFTQP